MDAYSLHDHAITSLINQAKQLILRSHCLPGRMHAHLLASLRLFLLYLSLIIDLYIRLLTLMVHLSKLLILLYNIYKNLLN